MLLDLRFLWEGAPAPPPPPPAQDEPHYGWSRRQIQRPPPPLIPVHVQIGKTVVELPILEPVATSIDNHGVIATLYAAGAIDEEEFTALISGLGRRYG